MVNCDVTIEEIFVDGVKITVWTVDGVKVYGAEYTAMLTFTKESAETSPDGWSSFSQDANGVCTLTAASYGADRGWGTYGIVAVSSQQIDVSGYQYVKVYVNDQNYAAAASNDWQKLQVGALSATRQGDGWIVLDVSSLSGLQTVRFASHISANYNYDQQITAKGVFQRPIVTNIA